MQGEAGVAEDTYTYMRRTHVQLVWHGFAECKHGSVHSYSRSLLAAHCTLSFKRWQAFRHSAAVAHLNS
jgi:hypothetical protein